MPIPWSKRNEAWRAQYAEKRKGADKGRKRSGKHSARVVRFLAVDGEGLTRDDEQHDYVTLQASDNTMVEAWERDGLSTAQCFDYLIDLHTRHPKSTLIAFAFGYDVNMMLRDVNRAELERINDGDYTVVGERYLVKFIAGKSFYVGRGHYEMGGWKTDTGVTVWDTWGFFQSSFVKALELWGVCSAETIDIIARMKDRRGEFTDEMRALITSYCFRECDLLVELMTEFKAVADAAGIHLTRWDGAGAAASALLRQHDMRHTIEASRKTPDAVERAALYAYYGGRIEIAGSGVVPDECYEYDINSAYPAEIANLPSLDGAIWRHVDPEWIQTAPYGPNGLYHVAWDLTQFSPIVGPFPWRTKDGEIVYPMRGEGWYHAVEVAAALDVYPLGITLIEGWEPVISDHGARPFAWVHDLYSKRQIYKQTNDARGIVIKLALNAMYGKLAQSIGYQRGIPPSYQSYYLAGRVTAGTRAKILRAAVVAGDALISTMTDALFTRVRVDVPLSKELGDWDETVLNAGLLVVQPGVVLTPPEPCGHCDGSGCYRCASGQRMAYGRSRGFGRSSLNYADARAAWDRGGAMGGFQIIERRFVGMGRALAYVHLAEWHLDREPERDILGRLISDQWRRWVEIEKRVSFAANTKRKDYCASPYPDWCAWLPPEGTMRMGTIYKPKTVFRAIEQLAQADAADNNGIEGVGVGV